MLRTPTAAPRSRLDEIVEAQLERSQNPWVRALVGLGGGDPDAPVKRAMEHRQIQAQYLNILTDALGRVASAPSEAAREEAIQLLGPSLQKLNQVIGVEIPPSYLIAGARVPGTAANLAAIHFRSKLFTPEERDQYTQILRNTPTAQVHVVADHIVKAKEKEVEPFLRADAIEAVAAFRRTLPNPAAPATITAFRAWAQQQYPAMQDPIVRQVVARLAEDHGFVEQLGLTSEATSQEAGKQAALLPGEMHKAEAIEAIKAKYAAPQRAQASANQIRNDFLALPSVKAFQQSIGAFGQMQEVFDGPQTTAGDWALIVGYAKINDPDSVAREGEQAAVRGLAAVDDRIRNAYDLLLKKKLLTPEIRSQIRDAAQRLVHSRLKTHEDTEKVFKDIARKQGAGEAEAVPDLVGRARALLKTPLQPPLEFERDPKTGQLKLKKKP